MCSGSLCRISPGKPIIASGAEIRGDLEVGDTAGLETCATGSGRGTCSADLRVCCAADFQIRPAFQLLMFWIVLSVYAWAECKAVTPGLRFCVNLHSGDGSVLGQRIVLPSSSPDFTVTLSSRMYLLGHTRGIV